MAGLMDRRSIRALTRRTVLGGISAGLAGVGLPGGAHAATVPVNIVNTSGNTNVVLATMLKQQGFLDQVGLDATITHVADGSKLIGSLLSGDMDICALSGFGQVLPAIEKGAKLKILAGGAVLPLQSIFSKKAEIKTVRDLEGKTIGTGSPGALLHQMVVAVLRKNGVDEKKVTFVNIGSSTDVFRGVVAGTVDAGPAEAWLDGKSGVHAIDGGRFYKDLTEYTYQASYGSDRAIAGRRESLVRTLAAYVKLYRFLGESKSREPFAKAFAAATGKDDREEADLQWAFYAENKPFSVDLVLSEERVRYMQELNKSFGVQKVVLPYDQTCDMSIARDALKLAA